MYTTYRIKIARKSSAVKYIKRTWPECFVTDNASEAFEFHCRDDAERWIEQDGGVDAEIEEVEHLEYADVVAWIVEDHNSHLPLNDEGGITEKDVTPEFAADYLADSYYVGGYGDPDPRPRPGDDTSLDRMFAVVQKAAKMLTTVEAAALLGVTRRQIIKLISEGKLRASRFGRAWQIEPASVEEYRQSARQVGYPRGRARKKQ